MRLAMPDEARQLPIAQPEQAIDELAAILGKMREGAAADLEAIATQTVETAAREGAILMAVVTPPRAAPALLTGVVLTVPPSWDTDTAAALRDSMEDLGGPDVRETATVDTDLGPAVIVQRIPGREQARERRALTVQLQAFVPEPGTGRMLLLTLACPSTDGWDAHQRLFAELVASAGPSEPGAPAEAPVEQESFEEHTYRL
jgi:hypothetical protein